jgi:hypothetical protein
VVRDYAAFRGRARQAVVALRRLGMMYCLLDRPQRNAVLTQGRLNSYFWTHLTSTGSCDVASVLFARRVVNAQGRWSWGSPGADLPLVSTLVRRSTRQKVVKGRLHAIMSSHCDCAVRAASEDHEQNVRWRLLPSYCVSSHLAATGTRGV